MFEFTFRFQCIARFSILLFTVFTISSCEDDVVLEPQSTSKDSGGSYAKIVMPDSSGQLKSNYTLQKSNPEVF